MPMITTKVKINIVIALFGVMFMILLSILLHLLFPASYSNVSGADKLTLAGIVASLITVTVAIPGIWLVVGQLKQLLARPKLIPQFIVRLRPNDIATEPCYYTEISIFNDSVEIAHNFRLLLYCYTPTNPGDPQGGPWPVNIISNQRIESYPTFIDMNNYATMMKTLEVENYTGVSYVSGCEIRVKDVNIYERDSLYVATLEVFGDHLKIKWRLDSEGGTSIGSEVLVRPRDAEE